MTDFKVGDVLEVKEESRPTLSDTYEVVFVDEATVYYRNMRTLAGFANPASWVRQCYFVKPKIKKVSVTRWFNCYPDGSVTMTAYPSKEMADKRAMASRVACVPVLVEYEYEEK